MKGKEHECEQLPKPDHNDIPGCAKPAQHREPESDLVQSEALKELNANQTDVVPKVSNDGVIHGEEPLVVDEDGEKQLRTAIMVRVYSKSGLGDLLLIYLAIPRRYLSQN